MSDKISKATSFLPDAFYDIIAYVVPSTLLVGDLFLLKIITITDEDYSSFFTSTSWALDIILGILILGVLYSIGVVLSTLSYGIVRKPILWVIKLIKVVESDNKFLEYGLGDLMLEITKENHHGLYLEMTKRAARVILLRNLVLVFLILTVLAFFKLKVVGIIVHAVIFVTLIFAYYKRHLWFITHFEIASKVMNSK